MFSYRNQIKRPKLFGSSDQTISKRDFVFNIVIFGTRHGIIETACLTYQN